MAVSATQQQILFNVVTSLQAAGVNGNYQIPALFGNNSAITYANGTAAGSTDILLGGTQTLAASTPLTVALNTINDIGGTSRSPLRCRYFLAGVSDATLSHTVAVTAGASNPWTYAPTITLFPGGGFYVLVNDWTSVGGGVGAVITSGSNSIEFNPGSNTVTGFSWLALCCSATS